MVIGFISVRQLVKDTNDKVASSNLGAYFGEEMTEQSLEKRGNYHEKSCIRKAMGVN